MITLAIVLAIWILIAIIVLAVVLVIVIWRQAHLSRMQQIEWLQTLGEQELRGFNEIRQIDYETGLPDYVVFEDPNPQIPEPRQEDEF